MRRLVRTAKEMVRHAFYKGGLARSADHLRPAAMQERFAKIYEDGVWQLGQTGQPLSGHGSSLAATAGIRRDLPSLLEILGSKSVLDVGCGDMTWMSAVDLQLPYIGVDIVPSVIEGNRAKMPLNKFYCLNATTDDLPEADTVLCREILFHLSFSDFDAILRNIARHPRKWLIATTDNVTLFNSDISTGDFRLINLQKAPYRFPKPAHVIDDDALSPGRCLAAWDFEALLSR